VKLVYAEAFGTICDVLLIPQFGGVRFKPNWTTPVPLNDTVFGDEGAVLVIVSVPFDVTVDVGANVTFRFRLWFAVRTVLPENPLTAKGALV